MKRFEELKMLVHFAEKDALAFYEKNNKAAGTRLRNALQQIKVAATEIRKHVIDQKKAQ
jgi:hypothetical protein